MIDDKAMIKCKTYKRAYEWMRYENAISISVHRFHLLLSSENYFGHFCYRRLPSLPLSSKSTKSNCIRLNQKFIFENFVDKISTRLIHSRLSIPPFEREFRGPSGWCVCVFVFVAYVSQILREFHSNANFCWADNRSCDLSVCTKRFPTTIIITIAKNKGSFCIRECLWILSHYYFLLQLRLLWALKTEINTYEMNAAGECSGSGDLPELFSDAFMN